jgi:hypothetical protein
MVRPLSFFHRDGGDRAIRFFDTGDLRKPRKPSASPSKDYRRNVSSAHFSKSMSNDSEVTISSVCTEAPSIP